MAIFKILFVVSVSVFLTPTIGLAQLGCHSFASFDVGKGKSLVGVCSESTNGKKERLYIGQFGLKRADCVRVQAQSDFNQRLVTFRVGEEKELKFSRQLEDEGTPVGRENHLETVKFSWIGATLSMDTNYSVNDHLQVDASRTFSVDESNGEFKVISDYRTTTANQGGLIKTSGHCVYRVVTGTGEEAVKRYATSLFKPDEAFFETTVRPHLSGDLPRVLVDGRAVNLIGEKNNYEGLELASAADLNATFLVPYSSLEPSRRLPSLRILRGILELTSVSEDDSTRSCYYQVRAHVSLLRLLEDAVFVSKGSDPEYYIIQDGTAMSCR